MSIAYTGYYGELDCISKEVNRSLTETNPPEHVLLKGKITDALTRIKSSAPLRLVLIGEWNSGKSSLIGALTGAEVEIDADVCTDVSTEYPWQGLTILDTPGIQAQGCDTDHDKISRESTVGADIILFVVTNELFNPRLAAHLRFILDDSGLGLAKKTALIVNKIDRETNSEDMLRGELQRVLGPHQDVPVFFCSARKLLESKSAPSELKDRFILQSRIAALTDGINHFIEDAGTLGKLSTPLQILADIVDSIQGSLVTSDDERKRLELIRRQKAVLQGLQRQLLEIRKTWKQQTYSTVLGQTESSVEQIDQFTSSDDLERLFALGMKQAIAEIEHLHDGVKTDIDEALDGAQRKLDEIGESPLAKDVERAKTERSATVKVGFDDLRPGESAVVGKIGKAAAKPLKDGLDAAAKNAEGLSKIIYSVGKAVGKKFRPWEAVKSGEKLASMAGKAGKAVPFLAAALDFYLQYREEKVKEEKAKYLANLRLALRNAFAEQAKVEAEALEAAIVKVSQGPVASALDCLDASASEASEQDSAKKTRAMEIASLRGRCTRLRNQIMSGVEAVDPVG